MSFPYQKSLCFQQISPKCLRPRNRSNIRRRLARQRNRFLGLSFWGNVWCTYEALTNQREVHQYIDHVVCFNTRDSHHLNKHTILHVFRARGYDSNCIIKLIQTLISERVYISNHSTPPPERYTTATTRSYPSTTCWKVGSWGLRTISPILYTYSSLSTVYRKL